MTRAIRIAPSLLSADFAFLGRDAQAMADGGADILHFDVMDNHYVPNLTVGPLVCAALRPHTSLPIDVHLMTRPVDPLIDSFAEAGADMITFHPEASDHVHRSVQMIRKRGLKAGVALNPASPLSLLDHILEDLDLVLIMSVNPGFGGQSFIPSALPKIAALRKRIDDAGLPVAIEVDGGVNPANARALGAAGADILVAGSAIFGASDRAKAIASIRGAAESGLGQEAA
ncbi:ribulose-phosphate 3-epimerase [Rhodospirillum rubrum]|uniref:Ribulose-phosphate 3-epimerase n=1 Tax=Rhodospirillum rubrum (strain ATCC 11170 / ATH 1.1.1 / DSM 467 / LMG 4362 / NCIMB 8255 / S1) TaxID=269796 RepID=Q2RRP3_RHORT|nr:ribulose-phosphate 3-epimerase [Rhodospirillum rubrum]ABC23202.1 ribulose-5-phosphate 3-epimerase [Rhodospirillum rubrum ATCC 11170]AEO48933.1 ribulose-5-phosphate 3-epimerase [Rhodospirillum rubrum F11]MBK5954836.1 ribulose-phosphate 3-epimerase [Rhodospirillum rubrum]QXG79179.1 ribulose-phosphate 3-epimerase [Rhodospirillum rubrum]